MNKPEAAGPKATLSDYLAAEGTLLAWIRTGLAMMGFGFVVARFGLFLQEMRMAQSHSAEQTYGLSLWFGTALIFVGVLVSIFAGWRHMRLVKELDRGETTHTHPTAQAVGIAVLLGVVGLAMAIYLISVRHTAPPNGETGKEASMNQMMDKGLVTLPSRHSVDETVEKLKGILTAKGTLFALLDHSGEAANASPSRPFRSNFRKRHTENETNKNRERDQRRLLRAKMRQNRPFWHRLQNARLMLFNTLNLP